MDRIRLRIARVLSLSVIGLCAASLGWALGDKQHVATQSKPGAMALANAWRPAAIYVEAGRYLQAEPKVKYRGTFLNDEAST